MARRGSTSRPRPEQAPGRAVTQLEFDRLLGRLDSERDRLLVLAGQYTGLRITELLSLKVGDVARGHTLSEEIFVHGRTIPVHPDLAAATARYLSLIGSRPTHYLFPSRKGVNRPITVKHAWRIVKKAARAAGLNVAQLSTRSLRRSFASAIYAASGRDLQATQRLLGHADVGTTAKYLAADRALVHGLPRVKPEPRWRVYPKEKPTDDWENIVVAKLDKYGNLDDVERYPECYYRWYSRETYIQSRSQFWMPMSDAIKLFPALPTNGELLRRLPNRGC